MALTKDEKALRKAELKEEAKRKEAEEKALEKKREEVYKEMMKYEKAHKKEAKVAPKDSYISLQHINKIYSNRVQAVFDFSLEIKKHDFIVFVGPSGCGKSTTLRMIAGLEDITSGDLYIDGVYANELEPKDRDISMVFQSYALYPHMTVYNNLAFGLKMRHVPKDEIDARVHRAAKILEIEQYLDRKPRALSGGQCQRVALGRAIVRNSKVFLMDEPLSNLDAKLRVQMRSEIVKLHEELGSTTIYVTHDQTEAMTMATKIVVLKDGYIQQIGTPKEIYNNPSNVFVATFIGSPAMNILPCEYKDDSINLANGYSIKLSKDKVNRIEEFYAHEIQLCNEHNTKIDEEINKKRESLFLENKEIKNLTYALEDYKKELKEIYNKLDKEKTVSLLAEVNKKLDEEILSIDDLNKQISDSQSFFEKREFKKELKLRLKKVEFYKNKINEFNTDLTNLDNVEYMSSINERISVLNSQISETETKLESLKTYDPFENKEVILKEFEDRKNKNKERIEHINSIITNKKEEVLFGIRPEDIGQFGFKNNIVNETEYFENDVLIAELLGNEYYVHTLIGEKELIAKVNANQDIKHGDLIKLSFDLDKIHLFDKETKKLIW